MKYILLSMTFMISSLFANYAYSGQNSGRIDMHGGKTGKLTGSSNFSSGSMKSLKDISKPTTPLAPTPLIKEKEVKDDEKKNK